jgi:hypothetical protein
MHDGTGIGKLGPGAGTSLAYSGIGSLAADAKHAIRSSWAK